MIAKLISHISKKVNERHVVATFDRRIFSVTQDTTRRIAFDVAKTTLQSNVSVHRSICTLLRVDNSIGDGP
jgi:hypothetical protein